MTIPNTSNTREFNPLHETIDAVWSGGKGNDLRFSNYYDYYFSGEDIRIYIDGLLKSTNTSSTSSYGSSTNKFNIGGSVYDPTGGNINGVV